MPGADSITSATGTVSRDPTCLHERACPISHSPCPGECAFALVMNSGSLGVLLFEAHQRRVVFANPEALRLVSLQGRPESYADFAELLGLDRALAIGPGQPPLQPEPLKLGGRVVGYSVYREDPFVWVFARDITDRARLETVAEAVESMNNIGYIFTTVRHEIGNPINSVKMALSVLRQNFDRFPRATALEYLERSLNELTRVEELLATLRSFSLFESARLREVDLGSFLADFARLVRPGLQGRGVRLEVELRDRPLRALLDPRALHQALLNLVTNAADAAAGRAEAVVRIRAARRDRELVLQVTDNGVGLTPEQRAQLFRPFVSTKPEGTGLGLVIVKKLVASMKGAIDVESWPGQGSTFTLAFPGEGRDDA